jgi:hypothetical protein
MIVWDSPTDGTSHARATPQTVDQCALGSLLVGWHRQPADGDRVDHLPARFNSLIHVLDLENFWQGTLCDDPHDESMLEAELESFLRNATQDERTGHQQYDDMELRRRLARIGQGMKLDIGRIPFVSPLAPTRNGWRLMSRPRSDGAYISERLGWKKDLLILLNLRLRRKEWPDAVSSDA